MRIYEVWYGCGKHVFEADEIKFRDDFLHETKKEPLVLYQKGRLLAILKEWEYVIDVTEKFIAK